MSPTTDTPASRALMLLTALGATGDEVAATLTTLGVKGQPCSGDRCPVARYLYAEGVVHIGVDRWTLTLPAGPVNVPAAIAEFVDAFDRGAHPDLIEVAS